MPPVLKLLILMWMMRQFLVLYLAVVDREMMGLLWHG